MTDESLSLRLSWIEARLQRVEQRLEAARTETPPIGSAPPTQSLTNYPPSETPTMIGWGSAPDGRLTALAHLLPEQRVRDALDAATSARSEVQPPVNAERVDPLPDRARHRANTLEVEIGMRWMAWAGAIVVVLAAGFFVKLAYDQGWFGLLAPMAKCAIAAAFGAMLLLAGEFALRRISRAAAVSLSAAGLGVLYLTAFATHPFFNLATQATAFQLLAFVALLGVGVTIRGQMLTVGVLSLVGGYLAPLLMPAAAASPIAFPLYLSMLLTIGLALSAWRAPAFRPLRYVALSLHFAIASLWLLPHGPQHWPLALTFLAVWWAMITGEALRAALRGESALGNAIASLLTTAWMTAGGCWLISAAAPGGADWLGFFCVAVAGIAAPLAACFGPGLEALRTEARTAMAKFAVALWVQSGVLMVVAVALHFDDYGQSLAWLALAFAFVEGGRRLPSRGVDRFGLAVGALALVRIAFVDIDSLALRGVWLTLPKLTVDSWSLLALTAIAAAHLAAQRLRVAGSPPRTRLPIILASIGTVGWLIVSTRQCDGLVTTGAWLLAGAALVACERFGRRQRYLELGVKVIALAGARWLLVNAASTRLSFAWVPLDAALLFNWQMFLALAIAMAGVFAAWSIARREVDVAPATRLARLGRWIPAAAGVLVLMGLSFEVDRGVLLHAGAGSAAELAGWTAQHLRALLLTLLGAAGGAAMRSIGQFSASRQLSATGWALLIVSALCWLGVDTLGWRVADDVVRCMPFINWQFGVGIALAALLLTAILHVRRSSALTLLSRRTIALAWALIGAIGLWLGSFEIDRIFAAPSGQSGVNMALQTGLSIYWGVYALLLLALGFAQRWPAVRYAGLGLLGIALLKVMILDMAEVRYLYRVLSLLGVGLLLMTTSVAYAKLRVRIVENTVAARGQP